MKGNDQHPKPHGCSCTKRMNTTVAFLKSNQLWPTL